jgi:hypothetical protein
MSGERRGEGARRGGEGLISTPTPTSSTHPLHSEVEEETSRFRSYMRYRRYKVLLPRTSLREEILSYPLTFIAPLLPIHSTLLHPS